MREIKFRGKRKDNGEWICGEGYYPEIQYNKSSFIIYNSYEYEVESETVGQYTGLNDGNDINVYYGDILKKRIYEWYNEEEKQKERNKKAYFIVKQEKDSINMYLEYNFNIRGYWEQNILPLWRIKDLSLEVVGNIYENPELLEVK